MPNRSLPTYVVDSCYLIDWLTGGVQGQENEAQAIHSLLQDMQADKCRIVISAIAVAEILPEQERYGEDLYKQFSRLLRGGSKLVICPVDTPLAHIIAQVREDFKRKGKKKFADISHLATAIHVDAGRLYTRDKDLIALNPRLGELSIKPSQGFKIEKIPSKYPLFQRKP